MSKSNSMLIFRNIKTDAASVGFRFYDVHYDLKAPPVELVFPENLSVAEVTRLLKSFIKDLRRYEFETPNCKVPVEPTEEQGIYRVKPEAAASLESKKAQSH
jgi:hypothetical protein